MTDREFEERLELVKEAIEKFGSYLDHYIKDLCKNHSIDAELIYNGLWIHALHRFPKESLLHVGLYRHRLYQMFCDEYRKAVRNPVVATENWIEASPAEQNYTDEIDDETLMSDFYTDFPVVLTDEQKRILFLWARYNYTYKELSELTGTPITTIADWIKKGRKKIKEYIKNEH